MDMSKYMLHSNFGKALTGVIRCIYLYIATSMFPKYLSIFLAVLSAERILKQNKNTSEFPRINYVVFNKPTLSSSVRDVVQNAAAKLFCFNVRVIKNKNKTKKKILTVYRLLKMGLQEKGLFYK